MHETAERLSTGTKIGEKRPWITSGDTSSDSSYAVSDLIRITLQTFYIDFARLSGLKLFVIIFSFVPAIFLNVLVASSSSSSSLLQNTMQMPTGVLPGLVLVGSLGLLLFFGAIINTRYQLHANTVQVKTKGAISSILYARALFRNHARV